ADFQWHSLCPGPGPGDLQSQQHPGSQNYGATAPATSTAQFSQTTGKISAKRSYLAVGVLCYINLLNYMDWFIFFSPLPREVNGQAWCNHLGDLDSFLGRWDLGAAIFFGSDCGGRIFGRPGCHRHLGPPAASKDGAACRGTPRPSSPLPLLLLKHAMAASLLPPPRLAVPISLGATSLGGGRSEAATVCPGCLCLCSCTEQG
uniref:Uncharacterized protein n=1 Tax=Chelonoidis abingdonii TaxID=106734 RepID=A0A8C0GVR8_CHEAB